MYVTRTSWERFKGQTEWKGGKPGTGLVHTACGTEIIQSTCLRTVWEDGPGPCASEGMQKVSIIHCETCDGALPEVIFGSPIQRSELIDVPI